MQFLSYIFNGGVVKVLQAAHSSWGHGPSGKFKVDTRRLITSEAIIGQILMM